MGHAALALTPLTWVKRFSLFPALEVDVLHDGVDLRVHDRVALDEIELYAEVLCAVAASDRQLTSEEIDEVLGLHAGTTPDLTSAEITAN